MASYLRPRRGKRSTANSTLTGTAALKNGEIFFEYQNGNSAGGGVGGIKMGNGSTTYSSLPYFVNDMNNDNATLGFTNSTASSSSADSTLLGNIIPSNNLKTVLTNIKQLLWNHSAMIAKLNSELNIDGSTGSWRYTKLRGLTYIGTYYVYPYQIICTNQHGGIYFSDVKTIDFPFTCRDVRVIPSIISGNGVFWIAGNTQDSNQYKFRIVSTLKIESSQNIPSSLVLIAYMIKMDE